MNIDFTNRETYLAFRANWKANYKQLSQEIREGKHALANAFRANDPKAYILQRELLINRSLATSMLETLKEAKEKSAEMRAARLAELQSAA
jgi:hypothetical protein